MIFIPVFFFELLLLFYLSSLLTKSLSSFFFRLTKSKTLTIQVLALIFLPGVIVHELAHLITAGVLFVKTGNIEFLPKSRDNGELKLGSLEVAKTDPVRRAVIGFAPILFGLTIIVTTFYYFFFQCHAGFISASSFSDILRFVQDDKCMSPVQLLIVIYIFFQIGNTMFSSKKDLEGTLEFIIAIAILLVIFYAIGIRLDFSFFQNLFLFDFEEFLKKLNLFLLAPIAIDIALILFIKSCLRLK